MGIVTVTIDDEVEEKFREKLEEMGDEKGAMGEAVSEALEKWIEEKESGKMKWQKLAEEGLELGGMDFDRDEANER